ncbi:MAG: hypothetical protein ACSHXH_19370 [Marivita sp.]|uniref:hypothetical protein n=1 Tax=Marivita sp. TaxID=2003365 RepID=UPI003EF4996E
MQHQSRASESQGWHDHDPDPEGVPLGFLATGRSRSKVSGRPDDPMGPFPDVTVQVFTDLGLNTSEIAQYFGVSEKRIINLKSDRDRQAAKGRLRKFAERVRGKLLNGTYG